MNEIKKPNPKDYPPKSPHDLEWGGVNEQYYIDLKKWEDAQVKIKKDKP